MVETFVLLIANMIGFNYMVTEPKHLTEENAWYKTYDWNSNDDTVYVSRNGITKEERSLTEEQYRDNNYTLNER